MSFSSTTLGNGLISTRNKEQVCLTFYIIIIGATLGAIAALARVGATQNAVSGAGGAAQGTDLAIDMLSIFGIAISILFFLLDLRNKRLVQYGELNLVHLEKAHIFPDNDQRVYYEGARRPLGLLKQEYFANSPGERNERGYYGKPRVISHSFLLPASFLVVIVLFIFLNWYL